MSMRNRRILITRQHAQAGEMIREIESRGGTAVVVPMIAKIVDLHNALGLFQKPVQPKTA